MKKKRPILMAVLSFETKELTKNAEHVKANIVNQKCIKYAKKSFIKKNGNGAIQPIIIMRTVDNVFVAIEDINQLVQ
jgi:hypothetical protein